MAAVTAQLIHESPLSAGPITTFIFFFYFWGVGWEDSSDIHVTMRCCTTKPRRALARRRHNRVEESVIPPHSLFIFLFLPHRGAALTVSFVRGSLGVISRTRGGSFRLSDAR